MRYELNLYIPEDDILHSYRREKLRSYIDISQVYAEDEIGIFQHSIHWFLYCILVVPEPVQLSSLKYSHFIRIEGYAVA
jgi:hypothetical protein